MFEHGNNICSADAAVSSIRDLQQYLVAMRLGETPVHIPNTMVKTQAADDTIPVTVWESRWMLDYMGL